ncbi:MAG TPA: Stp1/IreP family PP2C-type Ser/Thr phosphatase [Acidimicrobiales bacterium]|nr:Stp1/IreP family PP2C-type Ser/Thr phosphatase [Acidimicrobiales bacterium]
MTEQPNGTEFTTRLRWGAATDAGRVRSANEDSWLVDFPLFAVADGMGGHAAGEVASRLALDTLRTSVADRSLESLVAGVKVANARVFEMSHTDNSMRGMGTTLCAVALVMIQNHERLAVVNVGDSRVYVLQDGALIQVSEDHSLVESMVRQGTLTPEQAKVHPQRNILTRALGIDGEVGVDSWEVAPFSGDRYLLCSDGLFNEVSDESIARVLVDTEDPEQAAEILVTMANDGGGRDNITVVIVDVVEGLDPNEALPAEEIMGLEAFDPNATNAITPVGDWLDDTAPEPFEHELPPPLPPPFHTDAELDEADDDDLDEQEPGAERELVGASRSSRILTWRTGLFTVSLLTVVGIAVVGVGWYARGTYFVGFDRDTVTLFKGQPGGVLWFQPTVVKHYHLQRDDVPAGKLSVLDDGKPRASEADADAYVAALQDEQSQLSGGAVTTVLGVPGATVTP